VKEMILGLLLHVVAVGIQAQDISGCDLNLANSTGPWDYRTASPENKNLVERAHFTRGVESLTRGVSGDLARDIDYTLRVFPNHPRALGSMSKLARRQKVQRPPGSTHSVECWFQRAIHFQPNDTYVRLIYGIELLKDGKREAAVEQLKVAENLSPGDANVHYNLGLAYFDLGDYEKSLEYAHTAYRLGFPLPGLRDKLKRAGKWRD